MSRPAEDLIYEIRLFYQSLIQVTEELHGVEISVGMRAVMEYVLKHGPETVPNIARERRVTRQRIQTLSNQLMELGLIETLENPLSRRSPLMSLTRQGNQRINSMRQLEAKLLSSITVSEPNLRTARRIIENVREGLEKNL